MRSTTTTTWCYGMWFIIGIVPANLSLIDIIVTTLYACKMSGVGHLPWSWPRRALYSILWSHWSDSDLSRSRIVLWQGKYAWFIESKGYNKYNTLPPLFVPIYSHVTTLSPSLAATITTAIVAATPLAVSRSIGCSHYHWHGLVR